MLIYIVEGTFPATIYPKTFPISIRVCPGYQLSFISGVSFAHKIIGEYKNKIESIIRCIF